MRRRKWWAGRIDLVRPNLREGQSGSIVLEAAIVMPMLLFVLVAFSIIISLCAAQMALYSAASQSVRQIAAHLYPVELAVENLSATASSAAASRPETLPEWSEVAAEAAEWLPDPAGQLISSALRGDWRPLQNMAATELGRSTVEPFIRQFANPYILRPERVKLHLFTLPDLKEKEMPYLAIALEYEYPVKLPFIDGPIVLREQAFERVWISDASPAAYGSENEEDKGLYLQIIAIEPTPLRPGRKAAVLVKTEPGAVVSLSVTYKSGDSKAKHLGQATADEQGFVEWTWHVSGNTTPGIWQLTVEGVDKEGSVSRHFLVEKKP